MNIKIDWPATIAAILIAGGLTIFPFVNPCQSVDGRVCTWNIQEAGSGGDLSFTNFYGVNLYHP